MSYILGDPKISVPMILLAKIIVMIMSIPGNYTLEMKIKFSHQANMPIDDENIEFRMLI